jgi:hypothetical protein
MPEIDEERLEYLMDLVTKEHPDLDPYVIWSLCVNQILNEQGIYADEKVVEEIREQRKKESQFKIEII